MTAHATLTVDELRHLENVSKDAVTLLLAKPETGHWVTVMVEEKKAAHA